MAFNVMCKVLSTENGGKKHSFSDPSLFCFVKPDLFLSDVGALQNKKEKDPILKRVSYFRFLIKYAVIQKGSKIQKLKYVDRQNVLVPTFETIECKQRCILNGFYFLTTYFYSFKVLLVYSYYYAVT